MSDEIYTSLTMPFDNHQHGVIPGIQITEKINGHIHRIKQNKTTTEPGGLDGHIHQLSFAFVKEHAQQKLKRKNI